MRVSFKTLSLLLIAILSTTAVRSQELLTPSNYNPHFLDYEQAKHDILLSYYSEPHNGNVGYDTYFLCSPSFRPCYSLAIRESRYTDSLILTRATKNIWYEGAYAWADKKKRKGVKKLETQRYALPISKGNSTLIKKTFYSAIKTSSHFADSRMGCDGETYEFYTFGIHAEVWTPEKGSRTYRLVKMADSLCYAVEHADTAAISRQMPVCRQLTKEFRNEYPESYFEVTKTQKPNDTTNYGIILWNDNTNVWITTIGSTTTGLDEKQIQDNLKVWTRELFAEQYPYKVQITISEDSAYCRFRHLQYSDKVDIAVPAHLFSHDFIFNALHLPFGEYILNGNNQWTERRQ